MADDSVAVATRLDAPQPVIRKGSTAARASKGAGLFGSGASGSSSALSYLPA